MHVLYRGSGGMPCVFTAGPCDMSMHDLKLPGQCPGMPGLAGTYDTIYSTLTLFRSVSVFFATTS